MSHVTPNSHNHLIQLGARGRLVLPAPVRKHLDLHEGDRLLLSVDKQGVMRLTSAREAVRQTQGMLKAYSDGRSLVSELIEERRQEARDEG